MGTQVFIIAEAGVNHNGNLAIAKAMVDVAADAGADAVKFQTFKAEKVISRQAEKARYQVATTGDHESQLEMVRKYELNEEMHAELVCRCREKNIAFLSTPFDLDSIDLLSKLKLDIFKIGSGEITNLPYLRKIGSLKKKLILSTGMADLSEIGAALQVLQSAGTKKKDITVLHCTTEYPAPVAEVNLRAMATIREAFDVSVGYSDHTEGIEVSIAAAVLGATTIEKHFTLDKSMEGPDHLASLDPGELRQLVKSLRNVEKALGDGVKKPSPSEVRNREAARKSVVAARPISRGERFTEENVTTKRPGLGISPMEWDKVIGKSASRDYREDEFIEI